MTVNALSFHTNMDLRIEESIALQVSVTNNFDGALGSGLGLHQAMVASFHNRTSWIITYLNRRTTASVMTVINRLRVGVQLQTGDGI